MRTCNRSSLLVVNLIFITAFLDLQAQKLDMPAEVTGMLGQEVILRCQFIPEPENFTITLVQWDLASTKENLTILVFDSHHGMSIKDSSLKERVNLTEQSLKIRDVQMTDAGSYTCSVTTFPKGPLKETTKLVIVSDKHLPRPKQQMSAGVLSAIIISAVLVLVILTAAAYLTCIKRHKARRRLEVHIDTSSRVASITRPSYIYKDPVSSGEVVYADVRPKRSRNSGSSLNKIPRTAVKPEEVTYAEVKVYHQRPDLETVFSV